MIIDIRILEYFHWGRGTQWGEGCESKEEQEEQGGLAAAAGGGGGGGQTLGRDVCLLQGQTGIWNIRPGGIFKNFPEKLLTYFEPRTVWRNHWWREEGRRCSYQRPQAGSGGWWGWTPWCWVETPTGTPCSSPPPGWWWRSPRGRSWSWSDCGTWEHLTVKLRPEDSCQLSQLTRRQTPGRQHCPSARRRSELSPAGWRASPGTRGWWPWAGWRPGWWRGSWCRWWWLPGTGTPPGPCSAPRWSSGSTHWSPGRAALRTFRQLWRSPGRWSECDSRTVGSRRS